ncbi:MAG TPA: hypothetical protein PLA68_05985 [Panacibacter sp.]|nr:hypothetical protein [Panacibacter sp.]
MLKANAITAKTHAVASELLSIDSPAINAPAAQPNENKIENIYLKILALKNKTANRNTAAIPIIKPSAGCILY